MDTNCIHTGDSFEVLDSLEANSVHAIVTDPPYGLAFMGRSWDDFEPKEYQEWCEKWSRKALRVLKPGGHILAFSGNRTHHRLFSGVEDAGFEIRDTITWHYGSGFPKSLDVEKNLYQYQTPLSSQEVGFQWEKSLNEWNSNSAKNVETRLRKSLTEVGPNIEKRSSVVESVQHVAKVKRLDSNVTSAGVKSNAPPHTSTAGKTIVAVTADPEMEQSLLSVERVKLRSANRSQTQSTPKQENDTRIFIVRVNVKRLLYEAMNTNHKEGEVLKTENGESVFLNGMGTSANFVEALNALKHIILNQLSHIQNSGTTLVTGNASATNVIITKSTTEHLILSMAAMRQAKRWSGWKTSLKPATEYVVLARKPFDGTVAENMQTHGTGALNIGETRIGLSDVEDAPTGSGNAPKNNGDYAKHKWGNGGKGFVTPDEGRYPSNVIFDETQAKALDDEVGETGGGKRRLNKDVDSSGDGVHEGFQRPNKSMFTDDLPDGVRQFGDSGGPSRYFYTSKASKAERTLNGQISNAHPTVKPIDLMEYLIKLVTAENQIILDPFCGSGTTCKAAKNLNRRFIGIEKQAKWADVARVRCGLTPDDPSVVRSDENQAGLESF